MRGFLQIFISQKKDTLYQKDNELTYMLNISHYIGLINTKYLPTGTFQHYNKIKFTL